MKVVLLPRATVALPGWVVMVGFVDVLVTVSVAAEEVVSPPALLTLQRYCLPFSDAVALKLKVAVLYPVDLQFVHVVPLSEYCHWYFRLPPVSLQTEEEAGLP